jgi:3-carboxy-cis,cis-muconate cycloisomerase
LLFEALFVPAPLRAAVSDAAWLRGMLEAERALAVAEAKAGVISQHEADAVVEACGRSYDVEVLAEEGRRVGNPVEPLVRALRATADRAHWGATSQDILDTAMALVAREAKQLVDAELDGLAAACARLAQEHRHTVMAGRTLLQQATPMTFGLKAAGWLTGIVQAREVLATAELPAQLGGASGTLAALGERGLDVGKLYAEDLGLSEPAVSWHTMRVPVTVLGARLAITAGAVDKIALDVQLLAQTEVAEVREPADGGSSTMPHKRNPVGSSLARACALTARAAAGTLLAAQAHEHERAAGAWHAEWGALSEALAATGGAAAWMRETLEGLEVDAERMRTNISPDTLSEAARFGFEPAGPEDYLGSTDALIDRALAEYRR